MSSRRDILKGSLAATAGLGALSDVLLQNRSEAAEPDCPVSSLGSQKPVDKAIWATWYDLPAGTEMEFGDWLHKEYLPQLLGRAGFLWTAHYKAGLPAAGNKADLARRPTVTPQAAPGLGHGSQHIVLVGASSPATFLLPAVAVLDASATGRDREMLDLRQGVRMDIYQDMIRVDGPAIGSRLADGVPAARIQFGGYRIPDGAEGALWACYADRRLPYMATLPGAVSARLMGCVSGWPTVGILYEFANIAAHERFQPEDAYKELDVEIQSPGSPILADRLWPPVRS
jgi:hypothetical protein